MGNVNQLKKLKAKDTEGATKANVKRLDDIIKLFSQRKISNIVTAQNLIKGLASPKKKVYDSAFQKYSANIKELKAKQPLNQRMAETKKGNKKNLYLVSSFAFCFGNLGVHGLGPG